MIRVLITGKGSYIGTKVQEWLQKYPDKYEVEVLDMIGESWKEFDFRGFDAVYHVAGIAHADISNVSKETKKLYYKVNCGLAVETALKAKKAGVKQFIYMSSLLVYGDSGNGSYKNTRHITKDTQPHPSNFYGNSKWQAEIRLNKLNSDTFHVAILRPPMIYGPGCKGNYNSMRSIAMKVPFFPDFNNKRSVLYIGNLCEFVRLLIENGDGGTYWPQNKEYVKTSDFIREIAKAHNKKRVISDKLNWLVPVGACVPGKIKGLVNKAFGSLAVSKDLTAHLTNDYQLFSFTDSIRLTEV
ncbi:UDP-glucose 4-epimerase [Ruminococcaceae bacterium FB2012]|nr:UDP-glucose 4-epimerase [Ruminococcaceae bacterium FB2012]